jgi:hypothetical protein
LYLPLKVGKSAFEHGAVMGIVAALKLLNDTLKREVEVFFFAYPIGLLPCQARLLRRGSFGRLVLLCLDGFTLPAAGHASIISI